ncbi:MAG TPA: 3' terminal RNA ribose 2'-O-methyltransferase Hen1, partial [Planctomycetia bacterium]|nr:3' terminal RNA ribose 2'-O-methyltransferase Hen1 [Planctomycetia bacterium]
WSRRDFEGWANGVASRHGYEVRFHPIGPPHEEFGSPTQMAVFERKEVDRAREQDASAVESAP